MASEHPFEFKVRPDAPSDVDDVLKGMQARLAGKRRLIFEVLRDDSGRFVHAFILGETRDDARAELVRAGNEQHPEAWTRYFDHDPSNDKPAIGTPANPNWPD